MKQNLEHKSDQKILAGANPTNLSPNGDEIKALKVTDSQKRVGDVRCRHPKTPDAHPNPQLSFLCLSQESMPMRSVAP
ncbi:MAG: hypothetical protein ACE37E_03440 [Hyphomicrobiales bacterium]